MLSALSLSIPLSLTVFLLNLCVFFCVHLLVNIYLRHSRRTVVFISLCVCVFFCWKISFRVYFFIPFLLYKCACERIHFNSGWLFALEVWVWLECKHKGVQYMHIIGMVQLGTAEKIDYVRISQFSHSIAMQTVYVRTLRVTHHTSCISCKFEQKRSCIYYLLSLPCLVWCDSRMYSAQSQRRMHIFYSHCTESSNRKIYTQSSCQHIYKRWT